MAVRVLEHEPACVWAYRALKLADVWKKKGRGWGGGGGGAGVEAQKSVGGGELYSEELVERKEALRNGRSLALAEG